MSPPCSAARTRAVLARAALTGALAGLATAFGDYGALWLWLARWGDRARLLAQLVALEVPAGALLAVALAALALAGRRGSDLAASAIRRRGHPRLAAWAARCAPLPVVAALAPALSWVGLSVFSSARVSRAPGASWLAVLAVLALLALTWASVGFAWRWTARLPHATRGRALAWSAVGFAAYGVASKLDQHAYPNLYEPLHAALSFAGWVFAWLGVAAAWRAARPRAVSRTPRSTPGVHPFAARALALALAGTFVAGAMTRHDNLTVYAALFDARAATSHSLMPLVSRLLPATRAAPVDSAAVAAARRERERRRDAARLAGTVLRPDAHILLITIDALRADRLGAYGNERHLTPALDELAAHAVLFEHAYCAAPHSSYSLSSLMTSTYLHELVELGGPTPDATLATALRAGGYRTTAFFIRGIFHTDGPRLAQYARDAFGFERVDHGVYRAEELTDAALASLDQIVRLGSPPSLTWVHYFDVHAPYRDTSLGTSDAYRYDGDVRVVDHAIARLLAGARARLGSDVIVVVTSDHGEELRDHGGVGHGSSLYDEQARVPLIIAVPGVPARRVRDQVELIDLAPTLLGLVGVEAPVSMRGVDLRPTLLGEAQDLGPAFAAVRDEKMVVRWPYKLIADLRFDRFELYDLERDPRERDNRADAQPDRVRALRAAAYAWLDALRDEARDAAARSAAA
ncbi:MAG: sulfatase, partial [Myxococcales bacterium]|nr:sulfatase [Myxococcales bacterium]